MSQVCGKCGATNGDFANYCGKCGNELSTEMSPLLSRRDMLVLFAGIAIMALILLPSTTESYVELVPYEATESYEVLVPYLENVSVVDQVPTMERECTYDGCDNVVRVREVVRERPATRFREETRTRTVIKLRNVTVHRRVNWLFGVHLPWHATWREGAP